MHAEPGDLFVRKAPACTVEAWPRPSAELLGDRRARDQHDRYPARREAPRDAAVPRGDGQGRRPGRLLPGAVGCPFARVRAVLRARASSGDAELATTPRPTPSGSDVDQHQGAAAPAAGDPGALVGAAAHEGPAHRRRRVPRLAHPGPAAGARPTTRSSPVDPRRPGRTSTALVPGCRRRDPRRRSQPGRWTGRSRAATSALADGRGGGACAGAGARPRIVFANSVQAGN